jgi:hypothetical protein
MTGLLVHFNEFRLVLSFAFCDAWGCWRDDSTFCRLLRLSLWRLVLSRFWFFLALQRELVPPLSGDIYRSHIIAYLSFVISISLGLVLLGWM